MTTYQRGQIAVTAALTVASFVAVAVGSFYTNQIATSKEINSVVGKVNAVSERTASLEAAVPAMRHDIEELADGQIRIENKIDKISEALWIKQ